MVVFAVQGAHALQAYPAEVGRPRWVDPCLSRSPILSSATPGHTLGLASPCGLCRVRAIDQTACVVSWTGEQLLGVIRDRLAVP